MRVLKLFSAIACTLLAASCTKSEFKVGHHVFSVPNRYLLNPQIYFIPIKVDNSEILFVSNPDAHLQDQNSSVLSEDGQVCAGGITAEANPKGYLCSEGSMVVASTVPFSPGALKKVPDIGEVVWKYALKSADGEHFVAGCSEMSIKDGRGGLCRALSRYDDLVFSIGFSERDLLKLPLLAKRVRDQLSDWEIRTTNR
jgi:hypothetical protein